MMTKKPLLLILISSLLLSCGSREQGDAEATSGLEPQAEQVDSACYLRVTGGNTKDTFALKLVVDGELVSGKLQYLYYEKDWRIGNLSGKKKNDIVNAKWVYIQEGMIDSTDVSFRLDESNAYQKNAFYDNVTGAEILTDSGAYIEQYRKIDCAGFPKYDFDFGL